MGAHQDPVQGAVVGAVAVVGALGNGALDALVGVAIHRIDLLPLDFVGSFPRNRENIHLIIDFFAASQYNGCGKSKRNIRYKRKENCHDL